MIRLSDIERILDEDLTSYKRDVLEFNHKQLAKGAIDYIESTRDQAAQRFCNLQELIDVGAHVTVLLRQSQRAGRKTVRIDDILAEAEQNLAETTANLASTPATLLREIAGAPSDVVAALEALPDGAIVRVSDEAQADRECAVFVAVNAWGQRTWEGTGTHGTFATSYLANNCIPLTVIA